MSLGAVAQSPQQSASSASQPEATSQQPANAAADQQAQQSSAPAEQSSEKPGLGHNGGPDWRAMLAGEDTEAVGRLSRFQTPQDVWKSYRELEGKLSKRAEPVKLPENATSEQVAEYRKAVGVPEIADPTKPEAYLEAYKIAPPQGYEMSEVERGMITDYAKLAYEQGHSPREVKQAVDFFFQQQAASVQSLNRIAIDRQKEWQNSLRDKLGSREYEAQQAAGEAWLKDQFKDQPETLAELLNAQLPGGGFLGDHPSFFEMVTKLAMGSGYTDRIEANTLESGGRSLAEQQREIEGWRRSDPAKYAEAAKENGKLDQIIRARLARGEIDEFGNEVQQRRRA